MEKNAEKLKDLLCRPERLRHTLRLFFLAAAVLALAASFVCSPMIPDHGAIEIIASLTLTAPVAVPVIAVALKREKVWYTLRKFGRLSCKYLEENGLLEQAAQEFYSGEGYECALTYKGDRKHRHRYRRNLFTRNFIFIMSDNVVLRYSELQRALVTEATFKDEDSVRTVTYLILQMKDFSEIPAMCAVRKSHSAASMQSYEHNMDVMETIMEHIKECNPDCRTSMEPEEYFKA